MIIIINDKCMTLLKFMEEIPDELANKYVNSGKTIKVIRLGNQITKKKATRMGIKNYPALMFDDSEEDIIYGEDEIRKIIIAELISKKQQVQEYDDEEYDDGLDEYMHGQSEQDDEEEDEADINKALHEKRMDSFNKARDKYQSGYMGAKESHRPKNMFGAGRTKPAAGGKKNIRSTDKLNDAEMDVKVDKTNEANFDGEDMFKQDALSDFKHTNHKSIKKNIDLSADIDNEIFQ